jgi:hypothetical protein
MIKFILLFLISLNLYAATCTTTTRTNYTSSQVLSSSALNADFNQLVTKANAFDGGCVTDQTLELSALKDSDFNPSVTAIAATAIDWATYKKTQGAYTKTLGANTTFTFSSLQAGQVLIVALTNTASNYTVTWPTVRWAGTVTPTQTVGAKTDIYTFIYDGTDIFGAASQGY